MSKWRPIETAAVDADEVLVPRMIEESPPELSKLVGDFSSKMQARLDEKEAEGFGGWDEPGAVEEYSMMRRIHQSIVKSKWVDVANFAMMIDYHSKPVGPLEPKMIEATDEVRRKYVMPEGAVFSHHPTGSRLLSREYWWDHPERDGPSQVFHYPASAGLVPRERQWRDVTDEPKPCGKEA